MHDTVPLIVRRARHNIGVRKIYCRKYRIYIYGAFLEAATLARWGPPLIASHVTSTKRGGSTRWGGVPYFVTSHFKIYNTKEKEFARRNLRMAPQENVARELYSSGSG